VGSRSDDAGTRDDAGGGDDAGGPDAATGRHGEDNGLDRTSFYACAGGGSGAALGAGLVLPIAAMIAIRRHRRPRP